MSPGGGRKNERKNNQKQYGTRRNHSLRLQVRRRPLPLPRPVPGRGAQTLPEDRHGALLCRGSRDRARDQAPGTPHLPRPEAPRHSQHGAQGDGRTLAPRRGHVQRPCGRHDRDDEGCPRGADARGRHAAAADCRDAADLDQRGAHAARTAHRRLDQRDDRQVCRECPRGGAGRRGLLAARGRHGARGVRRRFPDRDARRAFRRRRRGRPGACDDSGPCP